VRGGGERKGERERETDGDGRKMKRATWEVCVITKLTLKW